MDRWYMAALVGYGSGGGIRQRWWDMAAVVVYGNNDEDGVAVAWQTVTELETLKD